MDGSFVINFITISEGFNFCIYFKDVIVIILLTSCHLGTLSL